MTATAAPATASNASAGLRVTVSSVPVWRDVLGAWHGQAIVGVRNTGAAPVRLVAADSQYSVTSSQGVVVDTAPFEVAVPPGLAPDATGYLVAGFTLPSAPTDALDVVAHVVASDQSDKSDPVELRVVDVHVATSGGLLTVTGSATNPLERDVRNGAVGAVLLDAAGRPLAAVVDRATAAVLGPRQEVAFRAIEPPAPPVPRGDIARTVAFGWASGVAATSSTAP